MTSRLYTNRGDTLSYTQEVGDKGVTTWFGAKGAEASFKARWIDDDTLAGAWESAGWRSQADAIAQAQNEGLNSIR
jgi:hypothetical protein